MATATVNKPKAADSKPKAEAKPIKEGYVALKNRDGSPKLDKEGNQRYGKPPVERVKYTGGTRDQAGLLTAIPTDYNAKKHLPPSAKDFASVAVFYDWKADQAEARAKQLRSLANDERTGGGKAARAEKKRVVKIAEQFEALKKSLEGKGVDIAALLASVQSKDSAAQA